MLAPEEHAVTATPLGDERTITVEGLRAWLRQAEERGRRSVGLSCDMQACPLATFAHEVLGVANATVGYGPNGAVTLATSFTDHVLLAAWCARFVDMIDDSDDGEDDGISPRQALRVLDAVEGAG